MVNIQLLCVGKLKEKHFFRRLRGISKASGGLLQAHCHRAAGGPAAGAPPTPTQVEGRWPGGRPFWPSSPKSAKVIALCVEGVQLSSPALAAQMEQWMVEGASPSHPHHWRVLRPAPLSEGGGPPASVHVPHDLSPPSGPGHGAGAGLPGLQIAAGTTNSPEEGSGFHPPAPSRKEPFYVYQQQFHRWLHSDALSPEGESPAAGHCRRPKRGGRPVLRPAGVRHRRPAGVWAWGCGG